MEFKEYSEGTKAYLDALFSGLVPCVVTSIFEKRVQARVTEDHKAYKKGEIIESTHEMIFPIDRLVHQGIYLRINTQYAWKSKN